MAPKERKFNPVLDHAKKEKAKQKLKNKQSSSSKQPAKLTIQQLRDQILHLNQLASTTQLNKHQKDKRKALQQQLDDLMFKSGIMNDIAPPPPIKPTPPPAARVQQNPLSPLMPQTNLSFIPIPQIDHDLPSEIYHNLQLPETIHTAKAVQVVIAAEAILNKRKVDMTKVGQMIPTQVVANKDSKDMDLEYKRLMEEVNALK